MTGPLDKPPADNRSVVDEMLAAIGRPNPGCDHERCQPFYECQEAS